MARHAAFFAKEKKVYPFLPHCSECGAQLVYEGEPHSTQCSKRSGFVPQDAVEYTVYVAYACYPSLYGRNEWTRWQIFHHLFFVNGNGYEWKKGALFPVLNRHFLIGKPLRFKTGREYALDMVQRWGMSEAQIEEQAENEERRWLYGRRLESIYPLCEYSTIFLVPEDVRREWLVAAIEAIEMALTVDLSNQREKWIQKLHEQHEKLLAFL